MEKLLERDPAKDILEFCRRENEKASQRAQDATYADDCVSTNARFWAFPASRKLSAVWVKLPITTFLSIYRKREYGTKLSKSLTLFSKHVQIIVYSSKGTRYHVTSF